MLPNVIEAQILLVEGLREYGENAVEHPEGFALEVIRALYANGFTIERCDNDGMRQETTAARATAKPKTKVTE